MIDLENQSVSQKLEDAFREAGVLMGHAIAAQLLEEWPVAADDSPRMVFSRDPKAASRRSLRPPTKPKLLPGLSGRRRRPGEAPPSCGRAGCGKPSRTRGYCQTHYVQWLRAGESVLALVATR